MFDLYGWHPTIPGYIKRALAGDSFWYTVEVGDAVYETWMTPVRDASGQAAGFTAVSNDVSHVRKLQNQAIQNDRVIALGTLAASVAHEINNPLTYVLANSDALAEEIDALELQLTDQRGASMAGARASLARIREALVPIRSGTSRIAGITRDLRSFSRPDESTLTRVDIRKVVESVLRLVAKEVEARALLVLEVQDTPPVIGNEARLVQVVLNLIVNAYQSLPSETPSHNQVHVATHAEAGKVVIEVGDSGPGVPTAYRQLSSSRSSRPRRSARGPGWGCSSAATSCAASRARSRSRTGLAAARCSASSCPSRPRTAAAAVAQAPPPAARGGHVVLIDDDAMVARALALQLTEAGYRVTTFADGHSGMQALLGADDVDLVFCDLMMTGMTGIELAERLADRRAASWPPSWC